MNTALRRQRAALQQLAQEEWPATDATTLLRPDDQVEAAEGAVGGRHEQ